MTSWSTRFNPTISGDDLHLGHLYLALVNEYEAHNSGGLFELRFDDTQTYWNEKQGIEVVQALKPVYLSHLQAFGLRIDRVTSQSELLGSAHLQRMVNGSLSDIIRGLCIAPAEYAPWQVARDIGNPGEPVYPFTDYLTFEKVLFDFLQDTRWLIRGRDLMSEMALYCHYVTALRFPHVVFDYLPRLRIPGEYDGMRDSISKSNGTLKLGTLLDKYDPLYILSNLREACLVEYSGPWSVENIKEAPALSPEFMQKLRE